jgi:hypothetical protein
MACPYFMPTERLENGSWPHPARLPLAGGWNGHCTAPGHSAEIPSQSIVEAFCNLGYADGCSWAPRSRVFDAVRFAVQPRGEKADGARIIQLQYVCERNHRPLEAGILQFDAGHKRWLQGHADRRIQKMAECFLESSMKRAYPLDECDQGKDPQ